MTNEEGIILKKLNQFYENHNKTAPMIFNGVCSECGTSVYVEIHQTSSGYGINGGSIFMTDDRLSVKCLHCSKNEKCFT
jgi:hypothetical protein